MPDIMHLGKNETSFAFAPPVFANLASPNIMHPGKNETSFAFALGFCYICTQI